MAKEGGEGGGEIESVQPGASVGGDISGGSEAGVEEAEGIMEGQVRAHLGHDPGWASIWVGSEDATNFRDPVEAPICREVEVSTKDDVSFRVRRGAKDGREAFGDKLCLAWGGRGGEVHIDEGQMAPIP